MENPDNPHEEDNMEEPKEKITQKHIESLEDFYSEMINVVESKQNDKSKKLQKELDKKLESCYFKEDKELYNQLKYGENYLSEVLEDFIVIGHTYSGERIKMMKATRPKDMDSLREAMKNVVIPLLMNGGQQ